MSRMAVELEGDDKVIHDLTKAAERAKDARPAMRKVRSIMEGANREQFESGGAYLGDSWAPLSPGTLARKARHGEDSRALRATGALEASLSGGKGRRGGATRSTARAGTSVWYAIFAQSGTKGSVNAHNTGEIRRPIVGLSKRDRTKSIRVVEKFLQTGEIFP
jgi:phage gpG-like protein